MILADEVEKLHRIGERLILAYDFEEEEHGLPFNFELRDAHRELRAALSPRAEKSHKDAGAAG